MAAANNEITYTDHGDLFLAAALNKELHETIVDRSDLRKIVQYRGSVNGTGSLASKLSQVAFDDAMAAANTDEVTAGTYTDLGTSTVTCTVARQYLARAVHDIYELVGGPRPGIRKFAEDMANAANLRFTDMVCALFTGFSNGVGTSGEDLTVDDAYDAIYYMITGRVPGPYYSVLYPVQLTHLMDSLRGEGGAMQWQQATADMLGLGGETAGKGYGYHGRWNGVDWLSSDSVNADSSDRVGAMMGWGALAYQDGVPNHISQYAGRGSFASVIPDGGTIYVEFDRAPLAGHTIVVGNYYVGLVEQEDARGVKITSVGS